MPPPLLWQTQHSSSSSPVGAEGAAALDEDEAPSCWSRSGTTGELVARLTGGFFLLAEEEEGTGEGRGEDVRDRLDGGGDLKSS